MVKKTKDRPWTTTEVRQLKWDYGLMSISDLAKKYGRTYGSVRGQARRMELENHHGRGYRKRICRNKLRQLISMRKTPQEIADTLGCNRYYLTHIVRNDLEPYYKGIYKELVRERMAAFYDSLRKPKVGD